MGNLTMVRWVRAAVLSLLVVATTLAAHASAGGALPDVALLLPLCALVTLFSAALLGRPLSWWWSATMLLAGQAVLHGALQLAPRPGLSAGGGHLPGPAGVHAVPEGGGAALKALTAWSGDARMVMAHVGVAVLVGAWLAAGERAVWSLVALAAGTLTGVWRRAGHALSLLLSPSFVVPRRLSAPGVLVPAPVGVGEARSGATRRGPPARGRARSF